MGHCFKQQAIISIVLSFVFLKISGGQTRFTGGQNYHLGARPLLIKPV